MPTPIKASAPKAKKFIVFDMDGVLLYRNDIYGQFDLHEQRVKAGLAKASDTWKAKQTDVSPLPDFFWQWESTSTFYYLRPGVKEALDYAKTHFDGIYAFSASSEPAATLHYVGLDGYFDTIFGRDGFTALMRDTTDRLIPHKMLNTIRNYLGINAYDELFIIDDNPQWIVPSSPNDHIIPIPPFKPNYKLYGVEVMKHNVNDPNPTDSIPPETVLFDTVRSLGTTVKHSY